MVAVAVTDEPRCARAEVAVAERLYDALPSYRRVLDLEGVASQADLLLAGTLERIVAGRGDYVDAGVTELRLLIGSSDGSVRARRRDALAELVGG